MTRVLLYSDEPILAKGLESVLRQVEGFELLPTCTTVSGVADQVAHGGADLVLLPEFPMSLADICKILKRRQAGGKSFSIVAVAEGFKLEGAEIV